MVKMFFFSLSLQFTIILTQLANVGLIYFKQSEGFVHFFIASDALLNLQQSSQ